jgi:hypothetical protein
LVVAGLPDFVSNRLPRSAVKTQADLLRELNQLESLVQKNKKFESSVDTKPQTPASTSGPKGTHAQQKVWCSGCLKATGVRRYHSYQSCWWNPVNKDDPRNPLKNRSFLPLAKNVKVANNAELENELNKNTEAKN